MRKFYALLGVALIAGPLLFIGYRIYIGEPIQVNTFKGHTVMLVQNWMIETFGQMLAGALVIGVGVVAAIWSLSSGFSKTNTGIMMKIYGLLAAAFGLVVIYFGYMQYIGQPITLEVSGYRRRGMKEAFLKLIDTVNESLGNHNAALLYMALGAVWVMFSLYAGFIRGRVDK